MVPDKLPDSPNDDSEKMKRERALKSIRTNLVEATKRLNEFVHDKQPEEILQQIHTAKTEIINDSDETEIVSYYTLWTDFADMRLTQSGQLLRSDDYDNKYTEAASNGFDKSDVVSLYDLRNSRTYQTIHLLSLAEKLAKFLQHDTK